MPNHLHVLVDVQKTPLWKIVQNWKVRIAMQIRRLERRAPARRESSARAKAPEKVSMARGFWEREYWDTFMRDEEQIQTAIRYIENNPLKAGLRKTLNEPFFSSARFRDSYRRLIMPASDRISERRIENAPSGGSALQKIGLCEIIWALN
jgi:putative transposase